MADEVLEIDFTDEGVLGGIGMVLCHIRDQGTITHDLMKENTDEITITRRAIDRTNALLERVVGLLDRAEQREYMRGAEPAEAERPPAKAELEWKSGWMNSYVERIRAEARRDTLIVLAHHFDMEACACTGDRMQQWQMAANYCRAEASRLPPGAEGVKP